MRRRVARDETVSVSRRPPGTAPAGRGTPNAHLPATPRTRRWPGSALVRRRSLAAPPPPRQQLRVPAAALCRACAVSGRQRRRLGRRQARLRGQQRLQRRRVEPDERTAAAAGETLAAPLLRGRTGCHRYTTGRTPTLHALTNSIHNRTTAPTPPLHTLTAYTTALQHENQHYIH